jgi:hypothetical protein
MTLKFEDVLAILFPESSTATTGCLFNIEPPYASPGCTTTRKAFGKPGDISNEAETISARPDEENTTFQNPAGSIAKSVNSALTP